VRITYWLLRDRVKKRIEAAKFNFKESSTAAELRRISAYIRFYLKIEPDDLTDDKFAQVWRDLEYMLETVKPMNF